MFPKLTSMSVLYVVLIVLTCSAAMAAEPGWTYVEGGYLNINPDDLEGSGDSWFLGGAFGGKMWHVIGQYSDGDFSRNFDQRSWRLGAGWHGLLGEPADVLFEAYYVDSEVGRFSESGYRLTGGIRWQLIKLLELDGFVNYTDLDSGSDTSYEVRGIADIWRIGLGLGYEKFDDLDQWNAFVRFTFGQR